MISVTSARRTDVPAIANLIEEIDLFYGTIEVASMSERSAHIEAILFGPTPLAGALLARDGAEIVGIAAYSYLWPAAGVTPSLYLKELYVRRTRQHEGIGTALMRVICHVAETKRCSRVEWTTDRTNEVAMAFYAQLGAPVHGDKVFYRLDAEAIAQIAGP